MGGGLDFGRKREREMSELSTKGRKEVSQSPKIASASCNSRETPSARARMDPRVIKAELDVNDLKRMVDAVEKEVSTKGPTKHQSPNKAAESPFSGIFSTAGAASNTTVKLEGKNLQQVVDELEKEVREKRAEHQSPDITAESTSSREDPSGAGPDPVAPAVELDGDDLRKVVDEEHVLSNGVGFKYTGTVDASGKTHGKGVAKFHTKSENGCSYDGEWKNGKMNGKGLFHLASGSIYLGEYKDDKRHGKGRYKWGHSGGHGTLYDGEWKEDKKHGIGTCTFANVDSYEGEWKDDYANGIGIMRWGENGGGPDGAAEGGEAEVSRMATSKPIGEGVRWGRDRDVAWRLKDGKKETKISLDEAAKIAEGLGLSMPPRHMHPTVFF